MIDYARIGENDLVCSFAEVPAPGRVVSIVACPNPSCAGDRAAVVHATDAELRARCRACGSLLVYEARAVTGGSHGGPT